METLRDTSFGCHESYSEPGVIHLDNIEELVEEERRMEARREEEPRRIAPCPYQPPEMPPVKIEQPIAKPAYVQSLPPPPPLPLPPRVRQPMPSYAALRGPK